MSGSCRTRPESRRRRPARRARGVACAPARSLAVALSLACGGAHERLHPVVLEFPEPGLDDPAAYRGYATRFFRDAAANAYQV